jgi:hypothetical protein
MSRFTFGFIGGAATALATLGLVKEAWVSAITFALIALFTIVNDWRNQ